MREHLAKLLSRYTPESRAEEAIHGSCVAWLSSLSSPSSRAVAPGIDPLSLQAGLIEYAPDKIAPLLSVTPAMLARLSRLAKTKGATVEGATKIGLWLQAQSWITDRVTLIQVLSKWEDWHARAIAEYPRLTHSASEGDKRGPTAW